MAPPKHHNPPQPPHTFTATPEHIAALNRTVGENAQRVLDEVAKIPLESVTFENVAAPLIAHEDLRQVLVYELDLYLKLSPDPTLRDAAVAAETEREKFQIDSKRKDVFRRVDALYQRRDTLGLHPEHLRWLEVHWRNYVRDGMLLDEEPLSKYKNIKKRLTDVATEFRRNYDEEVGPVCWLTPEELDGIPEDTLASFEKGEGENEGKLGVDLSNPNTNVMAFCNASATRKVIDVASRSKVWRGAHSLLQCLTEDRAMSTFLYMKSLSVYPVRQRRSLDTQAPPPIG
jgi:metallopeptidase MepB